MVEEKDKRHDVLTKNFNTFIYNQTLHYGKKHICLYCLQTFSTEGILKRRVKDYFKINGKQKIIISKKGEYVKFKNYERKIKSPFIIYVGFESILVSEDNGKQDTEESYTNKYQKRIACSYGYKLLCVDDKFSKPFKTYLGKDAVYSFVKSMFEESKYCIEVMKKHFNKEIVMTKTIKILRTLLNVGSVTMIMLMMMLK